MTEPFPDGTLLITPRTDGCAWVQNGYVPKCPEPVAYTLTCSFSLYETGACVGHAAIMRHRHPDWIAAIRTAFMNGA